MPPIWNIGYVQNHQFTGRENEIASLRRSFDAGGRSAVTQVAHGLGGIGKTQIAIEYAYRFRDAYKLVWWIPSEDESSLAAAYCLLAQKLNLPVSELTDQQIIIPAVRDWLERHDRWLLVFDNANKPDNLFAYLPKSATGHVLITSRFAHWSDIVKTVPLDEWPRADSVRYVKKRLNSANARQAKELAKELGDLPLALAQATGYILSVPGLSIDEYLELYRTKRDELWKFEQPPSQYEATVATTWKVTVEKLSPASRSLLCLAAFWAADNIPRKLLDDGKSLLSADLLELVASDLHWNQAFGEIHGFSLVDGAKDRFSMHRMLQSAIRHRLTGEQRDAFSRLAVELVNHAFPYKEEDTTTWRLSGDLMPHVTAVVKHSESNAPETCGRLLNKAGLYTRLMGQYGEARRLLKQAIEIGERHYEPDHPTLATRYSNLALVERALGNFSEARRLLKQAIEIGERHYEPDHPTLATRYSNLALVERALGNFSEARDLASRALKIANQKLGPEHPTTKTIAAVLASIPDA